MCNCSLHNDRRVITITIIIIIMLYGLETCPLRKSDCSSLDFVVNRFFVKLFKTNNIDIVNYCRM